MIIVVQLMDKQSLAFHGMIMDVTAIQKYHFLVKIIPLEKKLSLKRYCMMNGTQPDIQKFSLRFSIFQGC